MRHRRYLAALGALSGSALAWHAAGCGTAYDDFVAPLLDPSLATYKDGGTDGSDSGKPDCSGDPSTTNVIDGCGVFAQADAQAGGDGKMATPYAKLGDAVAEAQSTGKRVYACTSKAFGEAVTISAGIEVYGGFDCTKGWVWSQDARAQLSGPADAVALTVTGAASGAKVEGFAITGASPSDMTKGGSSIAVAVDDVAATLDHCDVKVGDAADGAVGTAPSGMAMKGADAPAMMASNACAADNQVVGGAPAMTTCDDGTTAGGIGGSGGIAAMSTNGQDGADGTPAGKVNHGTGADMSNDCTDATKGANGASGMPGPGGSAAKDTVSLSGISSSDVTDGQLGAKAQGGGGGGGAIWGTFCKAGAMTVVGNGASGGGGGAGGCGGQGGGGGKAGGSSIAIVSLGTNLTLTAVTLAIGKAGKGGAGATGQNGGAPGAGAFGGAASLTPPSKAGCQGGNGGTGGPGGSGGGGRGGHAIGIAYAMAPATMPAIQMFTPGMPGGGGTAGSGAPANSNGALGNAGQCWDFGAGAACK